MRIGILTLPLHTNYGGILQAFALQTVLQKMGHEVRVINSRGKEKYKTDKTDWKMPLRYGWRFAKKTFIDHSVIIDREGKRRMDNIAIRQQIQPFTDRYIHCRYIENPDEIRQTEFDAFVVGSDQIWRPIYIPNHWDNDKSSAFLSFTEGWQVGRYAYAASFGVDKWEFPEETTPKIAKYAKQFDAISVREDSGVKLCNDYLGVKAVHLLDPTMLLSSEEYKNLFIETGTLEANGDMFCYILDKNEKKKSLIEQISKDRNLNPYDISPISYKTGEFVENRKDSSVEAWLRSFYDAKLVVTDSFHGCVFSIIFGKPFIAIGNIGRGLSRMQSLLKIFKLEDHLLLDTSSYDKSADYSQPESVKTILNNYKQQSINFLRQIK